MNVTQRIEWERITVLFSSVVYKGIVATACNLAVIVYILWGDLPQTVLIYWLVINAAILLFAVASVYHFKQKRFRSSPLFWKGILTSRLFLAGASFSWLVFFINPLEHPVEAIFYYFIIGGMVAGASALYAMVPLVYFAYAIPVFFPVTIKFMLTGDKIQMSMGALGLVFFAIIASNVKSMYAAFTSAQKLRFYSDDLLRELQIKKLQTEELNAQLKDISLSDPLSGLRNRRYLWEVFYEEANAFAKKIFLASKGLNRRHFSGSDKYGVLLIDVDWFKKVNDDFGHESGDMVLIQLADLFRECTRNEDILVRWGGEEFLIVLRKVNNERLDAIADKIRKKVCATPMMIAGGKRISITCSIGFSIFPLSTELGEMIDFPQTINLTDIALYHAKQHGRNQSVRISTNSEKPLLVEGMSYSSLIQNIDTYVSEDMILLERVREQPYYSKEAVLVAA